MPIQFNCVSCGKPIEIDDEFAGQAVTCPYCRGVVKAPPAGVAAATAFPAGSLARTGAPPGLSPTSLVSPPPARPNWFASVGLLCGVVILMTLCVGAGAVVKEIKKKYPDGQITQPQVQEAMEQSSKLPTMVAASWIVPIAALAGAVLSILGLTRREGRRWQAIIGVTICGLFATCVGLSIVLGIMGKAVGK